jgi:hypothetical protein
VPGRGLIFDDDRSAAPVEVLSELAENTRIIFFIHHGHLEEPAGKCYKGDSMVLNFNRILFLTHFPVSYNLRLPLAIPLKKRRTDMLTISRDVLEKNLQKYFAHIEKTGEDVIVTDKNNIPFIKLVPLKTKPGVEDVFEDIRGKVKYYDDILKPETEEWGDI